MGEIAAAVEKQLHALTKTSSLHSTIRATRWLHSLARSLLVFSAPLLLPQIITELCKPHGYQLLPATSHTTAGCMHAALRFFAKGTSPANTWSRNNKSHQKYSEIKPKKKVKEETKETLCFGAASIYATCNMLPCSSTFTCTCVPVVAHFYLRVVLPVGSSVNMHPAMA